MFCIVIRQLQQRFLHAYNQCLSDTLTDTLNITISNEGKTQTLSFQCYPNPITNGQSINISLPKIDGSLSIYNTSGKLVWNEHITQNNYTINTEKWAKGAYFIEWKEKNKLHRQKLKLL